MSDLTGSLRRNPILPSVPDTDEKDPRKIREYRKGLHGAIQTIVKGIYRDINCGTWSPANDKANAWAITNQLGTSNIFSADTSNERIGIGNATPAAKLDVAGAIKAAGALTGVTSITMTGAIATPTTITANSYIQAANLISLSGVAINIGNSQPSYALHIGGVHANTKLVWANATTARYEQFAGTGGHSITDFVGAANCTFTIRIYANGTDNPGVLGVYDNGSPTANAMRLYHDAGHGWILSDAGGVVLQPADSFVAIRHTSIYGGLMLQNIHASSYRGAIFWYRNITTCHSQLGTDTSASGAHDFYIFDQANGNWMITLDHDGRVGFNAMMYSTTVGVHCKQPANGGYGIYMYRATDSSPTGCFIQCMSANGNEIKFAASANKMSLGYTNLFLTYDPYTGTDVANFVIIGAANSGAEGFRTLMVPN